MAAANQHMWIVERAETLSECIDVTDRLAAAVGVPSPDRDAITTAWQVSWGEILSLRARGVSRPVHMAQVACNTLLLTGGLGDRIKALGLAVLGILHDLTPVEKITSRQVQELRNRGFAGEADELESRRQRARLDHMAHSMLAVSTGLGRIGTALGRQILDNSQSRLMMLVAGQHDMASCGITPQLPAGALLQDSDQNLVEVFSLSELLGFLNPAEGGCGWGEDAWRARKVGVVAGVALRDNVRTVLKRAAAFGGWNSLMDRYPAARAVQAALHHEWRARHGVDLKGLLSE